MSEFDILRAAAAGMDAQRAALDVAARNVAAAEATPVRKGFERLVPRYAVAARQPPADGPEPGGDPSPDPADQTDGSEDPGDSDSADGMTWADRDFRERPVDIAPAGSEADLPVRYLGTRLERGVDVDAVTEMVAVLDAQRAYETNASVFDLGKRLAERTIDVGRLS